MLVIIKYLRVNWVLLGMVRVIIIANFCKNYIRYTYVSKPFHMALLRDTQKWWIKSIDWAGLNIFDFLKSRL